MISFKLHAHQLLKAIQKQILISSIEEWMRSESYSASFLFGFIFGDVLTDSNSHISSLQVQ